MFTPALPQNRAHIDFETGSPIELRSAGVYVYAEHPETRVWLMRWRIGYDSIQEWRPGWPDPVELLHHVAAGGVVVAHNAGFERRIWRMLRDTICPHWPALRIDQQDCTMSRANALALPPSLDKLGEVLALPVRKDTIAAKIMLKMAKPRKRHANGEYEWWNTDENMQILSDYCGVDVEVETLADEKLPPLTPHERMIWELDQEINDRGVMIDIDAVVKAADLVEYATRNANERMSAITGGAVRKVSEISKLVEWMNGRGVPVASIGKGEQDDIIALAKIVGDQQAADAIELRRKTGKTSNGKYKKMMDCVCADDRIRGLLAYSATSTRRWAGRLVQPQNFPRVGDDEHKAEFVVRTLKQRMTVADMCDLITLGIGEPLEALSKTLRSMIVAAPGRKIVGGDFSNIEGRVNAWLAGEEWKLQAFRDYDAGTGPDLYKVAYARSFGVDIRDITKSQRQLGKVQELALGYQGGVGAFINMGATYGLKIEDITDPVLATATYIDWEAQEKIYAKSTDKFGLRLREWVATKILVRSWRAANPAIVAGWWEIGDAAVAAVDNPGMFIPCYNGRVNYVSDGNWLFCILPDGSSLVYAQPHCRVHVQVLVNKDGEEYEKYTRTVHFMGWDTKFQQWRGDVLYGGKQCENIVSGTARCLLDNAMLRAEKHGFPLILTVHDELVSEPPASPLYSADFFGALMQEADPWADGLPIAVSAFEDERYSK